MDNQTRNNERILNDLGDYGDAEFDVRKVPLFKNSFREER